MEDKRLDFVKNISGFSIATWVSFAIGFITAPITTRLFAPDQLGIIHMFVMVSGLIATTSLLGLDQALVRFYYEPPHGTSKRYLTTTFTLVSFSFLLVAAVIAVLFFWQQISEMITGSRSLSFVILLFVFAFARIIFTYLHMVYRMEGNIKWFTIQGVLNDVLTSFLYVIVAFWFATYYPAILVMSISGLCLAVTFMVIQRRSFDPRLKKPEPGFIQTIGKFALPLIPVNIIAWLNSYISAIILLDLLGQSYLGIFSIGISLAGVIGILQAGFNMYWSPYVIKNYKSNNEGIKEVHKVITVMLILFGLLIILAQVPISMILGAEYRDAMLFFPFLLVTPICYTISETTRVGINIAKKTFWSPIILLSSVAVNFLFCYLLIPVFQAAGAAFASAIAALLSVAMNTIAGQRYYKSINNYSFMILSILFLLSSAAVSYVFTDELVIKYGLLVAILGVALLFYRKEIRSLLRLALDIFRSIRSAKTS